MTFFEELNELIAAGTPVVSVTVVDAAGSVPNDRGAKMLVTDEGVRAGTVGGGLAEAKAIDEARAMLRGDGEPTRFVEWQLKRDLGMTCGGSVKLYFEAFNAAAWDVVVFGAGHVAQALISVLTTLECRVTCIDTRQEWLERLPSSGRLVKRLAEDMPSEASGLPDKSQVVVMTMGHPTDAPVVIELLRDRRFSFLGVIGSASKAARLRAEIVAAGLPAEACEAFVCPVGLPIGSNHPSEIAISIAAQLLQERDRVLGRVAHRA